jgi:PKD repeat protein
MKKLNTTLAFLLTLIISGFTYAQTCIADATISLTGTPGEVQIIDNSTTSSGPAATYSWVDFYEYNTWNYEGSVNLQPNSSTGTFQFSQNGTYTYYISVQDSITNCFDSIAGTLTINNIAVNCDASFSHYDTLNNQTYFYPNNYDANLEYYWDFGDGNSSNNPYPYHTYSSPGTYTACLTVWDNAGSSNCADTVCETITVTAVNNCDANFTYLDTVSGQTYFFPNNYDQNHSYYWDFGDGNTSNNPYPSHTYSSPGTYTACLSVWEPMSGGQCADTVCQTVVVTNSNISCDANFYLFQDSTNASIYYIWDLSAGNNLSYSWNFGDGTVSNQQYPTHTYNSPGIYNICLTITDGNGNCTDQYCQSIQVLNKAVGTTINVVPFGQTAGLEDENIISDVKLFPNPTSISINITLRGSIGNDYNYQILDVMGNQIDLGELNSNQNVASKEINVEQLQQGVYFVKISESTNKEKVKTLKFIKK